MWKLAALVACCGLVAIPFALASEGNPTTADAQTSEPVQVAVPAPPPCTPLKRIYARSNWQNPHPAQGENPCDGPAKKLKAAFFLWRHYRLIAPYRGFNEGDPFLKWLPIPAYIVACETRGYSGQGRWYAANSSGAQGPGQLLGWGAPYPANTPREKVRYWEVARYVLRVQGLSAWACA